ncbi:MAG: alpha/beta hydrolase [Lysobacterales bacterium]|jgi:pimeloyl-ACP methyl ester carboxylesterase
MADSKSRQEIVVLVHGLWVRGWSMALLARRLRAQGHDVQVFNYPTTSHCLADHADALRAFIGGLDVGKLHLVGHSMGGLVILNLLNRYHDLPPGRVVLMGSPVKGSKVVRRLEKLPGHEHLFGKARENLLQGYDHAPGAHETGMIRGTRALGLGQVTGKVGEPSDGTVAVSETDLEGAKDSVELGVTHTEMLVSAHVARQVGHFLRHGEFLAIDRDTGSE